MPDRTAESITGHERGRLWSLTEKLRIVAESHEAGARVTEVAARHGVCPSLLHGWRRLSRDGRLGASGFVPVRLISSLGGSVAPGTSPPASTDHGTPAIEVELASGGRILIRHDAPVPMLRAVIAALRG